MDNLKYVQLACSKDKTRENLMEVYRDRDCIVATDGHRLHTSNGLAEVEPHYLSGYDGWQFPDYKMVLPKDNTFTDTAGLRLLSKNLSQVKKVVTLLRSVDKFASVDLECFKHSISIKAIYSDLDLRYVLPFAVEGSDFTVRLNASYLLDALMCSLNHDELRIEIHGELGPVKITGKLNGHTTTAIVMPMRK